MKIIDYCSRSIRWFILFIMVLISACTTQPTPNRSVPSVTPSLSARMTIVDSITRQPSQTPGDFPTVTPHIYCEGSPESFLIVSERGRVTETEDGETLNLRSGPGTDYGIIVQIGQLETFYVVDGPQCRNGYTWFEVNYKGRTGWIAEGDAEQFYAEPYPTG